MGQETKVNTVENTAPGFASIPVNGISVQECFGDIKPSERTTWFREAYWKDHVARWQISGSTIFDYCKTHDLKAFQLMYWQRKSAAR